MKIARSLLLLACLVTPAACAPDDITRPSTPRSAPVYSEADSTTRYAGPVSGSGT